MYKISNLSHYHHRRLAVIHQNVMVPIMKYYINALGLSASDLEVYSAEEYKSNPGKEILFSIKGVTPGRILNDINAFRIPLSLPEDIYSVKIEAPYIKLTTN